MTTIIADTIIVNGKVIATFTNHDKGISFAQDWEKKHPEDDIVVWGNPLLETDEQIEDERRDWEL